jgi:hypothetical protein
MDGDPGTSTLSSIIMWNIEYADRLSADSMSFLHEPGALSVQITARHKEFGPEEPVTGSDMTVRVGSLRKLHSLARKPFRMGRRLKRDIIPDVGKILSKPGGDNGGFPIPSQIVDHIKPDSLISEAVSIATGLGSNILSQAASIGQGLAEKLEKGLPINHTHSIRMHHNINSETHQIDESRKDITGGAKQWLTVLPQITFIDSYAEIDLDVHFVFQMGIANKIKDAFGESKDDYESMLEERGGIGNVIANAYVEVEAMEDVSVQLQVEVVLPAGAILFCSLYLFPVPDFFDCVPLVKAGPALVAAKPPTTPGRDKSPTDTHKIDKVTNWVTKRAGGNKNKGGTNGAGRRRM